ncbi:MAG: hypothetical protein ABC585_05680 [Candidatus Methanosuratincola petrocarbonis]
MVLLPKASFAAFRCPYCAYACADLARLKTHVNKRHTKYCPVCFEVHKSVKKHALRKKDWGHRVFAFLAQHKRHNCLSDEERARILAEVKEDYG